MFLWTLTFIDIKMNRIKIIRPSLTFIENDKFWGLYIWPPLTIKADKPNRNPYTSVFWYLLLTSKVMLLTWSFSWDNLEKENDPRKQEKQFVGNCRRKGMIASSSKKAALVHYIIISIILFQILGALYSPKIHIYALIHSYTYSRLESLIAKGNGLWQPLSIPHIQCICIPSSLV